MKKQINKLTKKTISVKTHLLLLFLGVILIVIVLNITFNILFLEDYYITTNEKSIGEIAKDVKQILEDANISELVEASERKINEFDYKIHESLQHIDRYKNLSILVVNENYIPITASHRLDNMKNIPIEKSLSKLIERKWDLLEDGYIYTTTIEENNMSRLVYIEKLSNQGFMILTRQLTIMQDNIKLSNNFNIIAGVIALLISGLLTIKFSKSFTDPIVEMSKITENMSNLNFENRISNNSKNELGVLGESINILSSKLEKNIRTLNDEIEFQKLLSRNMSHELKTPISVIKGYAEGLTYGIADTKEMKDDYLNTIIEECNRMDNLVQEMLELSLLNSENYILRKVEEFEASLLEQKITKLFKPSFDKNGIEFKTEVSKFYMNGNFTLILQAISNFIANAINYGDKKQISLNMYQDENFNIIEVFNSGNSIPQDEINNIFQVFYRLDKARSRSLNAHGLGLAIVELIASLHDGYVYADNIDDGVLFILKIPKNF